MTPFERAMIEALPSRFPQRTPEDLEVMRGWNDDYANAMREVYEAFPGDLDVACDLRRSDHEPDAMENVGPGHRRRGGWGRHAEAQDVLEKTFDQ